MRISTMSSYSVILDVTLLICSNAVSIFSLHIFTVSDI